MDDGLYTVTRTVSAEGFDGAGYGVYNPQSFGGTVYSNEFVGLTQNGTDLWALSICRTSNASTTAPGTSFNFCPVTVDSYLLGTVDSRQLLIRPDSPQPSPLGNFTGSGFVTRSNYSNTLTSQSETFDPALFPSLAVVDAALMLASVHCG